MEGNPLGHQHRNKVQAYGRSFRAYGEHLLIGFERAQYNLALRGSMLCLHTKCSLPAVMIAMRAGHCGAVARVGPFCNMGSIHRLPCHGAHMMHEWRAHAEKKCKRYKDAQRAICSP